MKTPLKILTLLTLAAVVLLSAAGCGANKAEKALVGAWFTETNGVGMTVSFSEDNVMTVVCSITDKAAADAAGVNPDIVKSKNITCYYTASSEPDLSGLSPEEQELLSGKMAITSYLTEADMKNSLPGETLYFTISGETLTTTQRTGKFNPQTDVPEYSETVFTKNK